MTMTRLLACAALVILPSAGWSQKADPAAAVEALDCDARKFETIVDLPPQDGKPRQSRIRLCGARSQSDSQWVKTLSDAVDKLQANERMPVATRAQAIAAIRAEMERIVPGSTATTATIAPSVALPRAEAPAPLATPPQEVRRNDPIEGLPPLITGRPKPAADRPSTPLSSVMTPVPPPATVAAPAGPAAPRLAIACVTPGERASGCDPVRRTTMLSVTPGGALDGGWALRFVRRGEVRGEVALDASPKGKMQRVMLPSRLCSGVASSTVEFQLVRAGAAFAPAARFGPYLLRC